MLMGAKYILRFVYRYPRYLVSRTVWGCGSNIVKLRPALRIVRYLGIAEYPLLNSTVSGVVDFRPMLVGRGGNLLADSAAFSVQRHAPVRSNLRGSYNIIWR